MPTVHVTWPKDANSNTFSIGEWIQTLSAKEQEEWSFADNKHRLMVAAANSDAELAPD